MLIGTSAVCVVPMWKTRATLVKDDFADVALSIFSNVQGKVVIGWDIQIMSTWTID